MIYLFTGSDVTKVREKAFAWVALAREKQKEVPYVRLSSEELSHERILELAGSQGLFFSKTLGLIDDPFSESESGELLLASLTLLAESENPIAILAPKLPATQFKKLQTKAQKVFTYDTRETRAPRGFNSALVNALASMNGEVLWKEIVKALRSGDAPEMVHGLLHWKARDLMQKPNSVWSKERARSLSRALIELLSDSRGRDLPLKEGLERFALSLTRVR